MMFIDGVKPYHLKTDNALFWKEKTADLDKVEESYKCCYCRNVLQSPVQTFCGHRFCSHCIVNKENKEINDITTDKCTTTVFCPIDKELTSFFVDKCTAREINSLTFNCPGKVRGCPFTGNITVLKVHMENCSFLSEEKLMKSCPFVDSGCSFKGPEQDLNNHLEHRVTFHLTLLGKHCSNLQKSNETLKETVVQESQRNSKLQKRVDELEKMLSTQEQHRITMECCLHDEKLELQQKISVLEQKCTLLSRTLPTTAGVFTDDLKRTDDVSSQYLNFVRGAAVAPNGNLKNTFMSCNERLGLERTSYDGTFTWKIDDFAMKHQNALLGSAPSLFSTHFYTSKTGYKVCGRVYINGDGTGKGSHMSLFLVILKGEHDALLEWPFTKRVQFTLLSQTGGEHHTESFIPNTNSSSFQRPVNERNIASGIPQFIPLSKFHSGGYVKNNCMFIKIQISD